MLENLSKTDYIILFILALIIFIAGIVLVVFIKKSKKTTVLDKVLENEEQEEPKKIKKAEVGMKLACENIPPLEEKKPEIGMKLACENIPQLEEKKEKVNIDNEEVFKTKAKTANSEIIFLKDVLKSFSYNCSENKTHIVSELKIEGQLSRFSFDLKLLGKVQIYNAFTAICAVKKVFPDFEKKYIEKGLENAFLPGRFEIFNKNGVTFILDGAHTPLSIQNTIFTLKEVFPQRKYSLLFAVAKDKDVKDIVLNFKNVFSNIILTKPGTVRKSDIESAEKAFLENKINFTKEEDSRIACKKAFENAEKNDSVLLVTGSFYLLSEVKKAL